MANGLQPGVLVILLTVLSAKAIDIHGTRPPDACPLMCQCLKDDSTQLTVTVTCANALSSHIPKLQLQNIPSTRVLTFLESNFTVLSDSFFPQLNSLENLTLSGNQIQTVEKGAFLPFLHLQKLDLSGNNLNAAPPPSAFNFPNIIREVNLSHNSLPTLKNGSFLFFTELKLLALFNNSIESVGSDSFQGLDKLVFLDLSNNKISQLNSMTFNSGLSQLKELSLENNLISDIAPQSFMRFGHLFTLNIARNKLSYVSSDMFDGLQNVQRLQLSDNRIRYLSNKWTAKLPLLEYLDLSGNPLYLLQQYQLFPAPLLKEINLKRMTELMAVMPNAMSELRSLRRVSFQESSRLKYLNPYMMGSSTNLEYLDLEGCALQSLNWNLVRNIMYQLKYLNLKNNQWRCDCDLKWLSNFMEENPDKFYGDYRNISCVYPDNLKGKSLIDPSLYQKSKCLNATVTHFIPNVSFRLRSTALLECQAEGNPKPDITWYTPVSNVLHWSSVSGSGESNAYTSIPHPDYHNSQGDPLTGRRLQVLRNGNLFISPVQTEDAGVYVCVAKSSLGNHTVYMSLTLNFEVLQHIKIVSILVGLAVSVAFMLLMLIIQLVQMILNRWGWCCCRAALPPKAKRIRKMLESVEHYKTQQLDRLRENYNMQVQRIKDNCTQQMERLRDSYSSQTERLKDFRDYGTHQIDRIRDQYYEQVRRVRDYSTQQMSRVRENYVSQRNRIRKFSAHQLFKLRENYKVQQLHLNKILENLNLENCRTVCARTDSVMFNSEVLSMDTSFPADIDFPQPIPLPSSLSSDLDDIQLPKFELLTLTRLSSAVSPTDIDYDLDDDDDSACFQDAMDGTEFQLSLGFDDAVVVDPREEMRGDRPSNDIVV